MLDWRVVDNTFPPLVQMYYDMLSHVESPAHLMPPAISLSMNNSDQLPVRTESEKMVTVPAKLFEGMENIAKKTLWNACMIKHLVALDQKVKTKGVPKNEVPLLKSDFNTAIFLLGKAQGEPLTGDLMTEGAWLKQIIDEVAPRLGKRVDTMFLGEDLHPIPDFSKIIAINWTGLNLSDPALGAAMKYKAGAGAFPNDKGDVGAYLLFQAREKASQARYSPAVNVDDDDDEVKPSEALQTDDTAIDATSPKPKKRKGVAEMLKEKGEATKKRAKKEAAKVQNDKAGAILTDAKAPHLRLR